MIGPSGIASSRMVPVPTLRASVAFVGSLRKTPKVSSRVLAARGRSVSERQAGLWAAIESGYERLDPPARPCYKRRKRNQSISDRKSREGAGRHVATEEFCVARVASSGSCCPQYAQFAQVGSTGLSHFGHVGCSKVPQCGQNGNFAFSTCPQPGHGFGRGSRRMKYKIIPIALGTKVASSVHITYRICRRFASP